MTDGQTKPRRIAVVTYFFPPLGGVGVQRVFKYVRYLPQSGWQPVVFTPRDPAYEITDPDLMAGIPKELEVRRSFIIEPSRLFRGLYGRLRRQLRHARRAIPRAENAISRSNESSTWRDGARTPIYRVAGWAIKTSRAIAHLLFFPDEHVVWIPFAIRSIGRARQTSRHDAILSSSPPITAHIIAGLSRDTTPWIADFRDPWIGNAFAPRLPWFHRQLMKRIERWIVTRADLSVFATPSLRTAYAARYPDLADRFVTLTNGYDRRDLPAITSDPGKSPFYRMIYGGSLYGEHELELFLEGLRRALARKPTLRDELRIEFVGWLSQDNRILADDASTSEALADVVTFTGFRSQREALQRVATADCGLLIVADEPGKELILPVKLFDYIGMDRQVLAVVPPGDVEDLLRELDWGVVVRPEPDAIAAGILAVVDAHTPDRRADPDGRFDRVLLTARLAVMLDELSIEQSTPLDDA